MVKKLKHKCHLNGNKMCIATADTSKSNKKKCQENGKQEPNPHLGHEIIGKLCASDSILCL